MNDPVSHPAHYTSGFSFAPAECIQITRHLPFDLGNAFKYVWRAGRKGDAAKAVEDLDKALWYLDDQQTELPFLPKHTLTAASAVFSLLDWQDTDRFHALAAILRLEFAKAKTYISNMKETCYGSSGTDH